MSIISPICGTKRSKPCWKGYEMIGMKRKGKRVVPNCVPKKKKKQIEGGNNDMDEKTKKKLLVLEYGIAFATLLAISLTTWKTNIVLKESSKKI